jgi:hypothetical protein
VHEDNKILLRGRAEDTSKLEIFVLVLSALTTQATLRLCELNELCPTTLRRRVLGHHSNSRPVSAHQHVQNTPARSQLHGRLRGLSVRIELDL